MSAFEKGLCWTLYKHMENDFVHFMEYVPYTDYNKAVYSPKLLAMLLQICGYVDTVFKEMAKFPEFANIPECRAINDLEPNGYRDYHIGLARDAFQKIYTLSSNNGADVIAKLDWVGDKNLTPFADFAQGKSPKWWGEYNRVKHNWSSSIEQANMDNVLEALAGAFLLNAVHYPSIKHLYEMGDLKPVVKAERGYTEIDLFGPEFDRALNHAIRQLKPLGYGLRMETQLFIYAKSG